MTRLIDADALMEYTQNQKSKTIDCNDIARFPTAYNIEKVVAELEEKTERAKGMYRNNDAYYAGKSCAFDVAIEIVKRGGVE